MRQPIFKGVSTALATPFLTDGEVDFKAFGRIISMQLAAGINALTVLGTTGENPTISCDEYEKIVDFVVQQVQGRVPIIVGTGTNDTAKTIKLSRLSQKIGADALLVVNPYYNKTTPQGLQAHYCAIADSVSIPLILYNVPSRTGVSLTLHDYRRLSCHKNINGVKEASGNFSLFVQMLKQCPKDFYLYCGNDDQITPMAALGAVGVISVLSNIAPRQALQIMDFCTKGNYAKSAQLQVELSDLIDALFCQVNPVPIKAALAKMGLCTPALRLPLVEMSDEGKELLFRAMEVHGLL